MWRAVDKGERDNTGNDERTEESVTPGGIRPERYSVPGYEFLVLLPISFRIDGNSSLGRLRDAVVENQI